MPPPVVAVRGDDGGMAVSSVRARILAVVREPKPQERKVKKKITRKAIERVLEDNPGISIEPEVALEYLPSIVRLPEKSDIDYYIGVVRQLLMALEAELEDDEEDMEFIRFLETLED